MGCVKRIADTFKHLKQRVLWKYEGESLADCSSNVWIEKWMPQNDVLAHPNVVLFISHGGLLGSIESLHHGVPLLLIPFFGDQFRNAHRIVAAGNGRIIQHHKITMESFTTAITELTTNETYRRQAKYVSDTFNDNAVHPMDEAMFWVEHVAKFAKINGAKHLKSNSINMPWSAYLLLDVAVINLLTALMLPIAMYIFIRKLWFSRKKNPHNEVTLHD